MKNIFLILNLFFFSQAYARPIPPDQIDDYKKAVAIAVRNKIFKCQLDFGSLKYFGGVLGVPSNPVVGSTYAEITDNSLQPLLTFYNHNNPYFLDSTIVTTSTDFTEVLAINFRMSVAMDVNLGTLESPNIVNQMVLTDSETCIRQ